MRSAANPASLSSASQLIPPVRSSLLKPEEKAERQRGSLWPPGEDGCPTAFQQKGLDNLMNFPRVLGPYGSGLKHPQPQREPSSAPWLVGYATTRLPVTVTTTFVADVVTMVRAIAMDGLSMSAGLASDSSRTRTISTSTCKPINLGTSYVLYVARSALSPLQELRCTWSQDIVLAVANGGKNLSAIS